MMIKAMAGGSEYALGPLRSSLGFLTRVIQVQINERLRAKGGMEISPATLSLLQLLQANTGIRQVDAARLLLIQESNMANLVKTLISRGLIERRRETGGRGGLWITEEGERLVAQWSWAATIDRSCASVLSDAEYQQLMHLLNRIYQASLA